MVKSLEARIAELEAATGRRFAVPVLWALGPWMSAKAQAFSGQPVTVHRDVREIHALGRRWDRSAGETETAFVARVKHAEGGRSRFVFAVVERNSYEVA